MYELCDLINLIPKKSHIVGYSMGGRIALSLIYSYPEYFEKAIILSAHLGLTTAEERRIRQYEEELLIDRLRADGIESFIQSWYQKPLFQNAPIPSYRYRQSPDLLVKAIRKFSLAKQQNFWNSLPKISSFTTFLYGEHDQAYRKTFEMLTKLEATAYLIKEGSHAIHLQNARDCINYIERSINANTRIKNCLGSNRSF
jgi:2-succinyl-6-hydroxy-2,4-cyclohexadiene-1-carboxylate synthase